MIDPKELHIGSHVMVDGVKARVIRIDEPMENEIPPYPLLRFKAIIDGEVRDCGGSADSDKIQPIPITAELLEELGFRLLTLKFGKFWIREDLGQIEEDKEWWTFDGDNDIHFPFQYLHELEAFLYLTTKTELIKD